MNFPWLIKMAWRDSRRNRSRLLLFISSIILGIAALVAIYSLGDNLRKEIDDQAAGLLGADIEISNNKAVPPAIKAMIDSLGDRRSEERNFSSMIYFIKSGGTRLVQVKALGGEFPYYGQLDTEPVDAALTFRKTGSALVEQTLMLQYKALPGDSIKIGNKTYVIAGSLSGAPGQTGISASVAPIVYIPLSTVEETGLLQRGSRVGYRYYIKYDKNTDIQKIVDRISPRLEPEGINYETVESKREDTTRSLRDVTRFLSLVGFIALLLGCIGVASSIHIYVKEKINTIAVLRCLGATSLQAFLIYLIQILGIGIIGSIAGAALGTVIQQFLPSVLKEFLPIDIASGISWSAVLQGIILGIIISVLFALLPLVSIRRISPLNTLRISFQPTHIRDPLKWVIYIIILAFIFLFTSRQLGNIQRSVMFVLGLTLAFLILAGIARLLMWLVRKFFPTSWSYLWRQGLANLYRPNNQTGTLILSIGLGTTLICTLFFIQSILLQRVSLSASGNQSNMILFDIQTSQKDSVMKLARDFGLPVNGTVPIVNLRLESINKISLLSLKKDSSSPIKRWVFNREYRVTFRDSITSSEKIAEGSWHGNVEASRKIFISVEKRFAVRNHIKPGDAMVFNVQGSEVATEVGSLRDVDWNRVQTNFLIVFPKGVLEDAPQFHVLTTRVPSLEASAEFQRAVVKKFPNVSMIDLGLILNVLDKILEKIGFVIRFMAGFSILTGLIVLIASVLISKYQRMQESVLLRTIGASRRQIYVITALEYFFLGAFAALTGIVLSVAASWALAKYIFETPFTPAVMPVIIVFFSICILTVLIGLINSRAVVNRSPLEILRQE